MANPSPAELESLVFELLTVTQSYSDAQDLNGYMSRVQIIDKAKKLIRSLVAPEMMPNYHGLNMAELYCIRTFMKLRVLEAIPREGAVSFPELSKATGVQESLLERMGRVLVATGFLKQTSSEGGDFIHTKFSQSYVTYPGPGQLFLAMYDEWFENMHNFHEYLAARGQLSQAREPDDPLHNPYTWTHKQDGTPVWSIMAQDPEKIQTFQAGLSGIDIAVPVVGHFDFNLLENTTAEDEEERVELIDVGGGHGACLKQILSQYPKLNPKRCILQERPDVIEMAKASGGLPEGLQLIEHDFFTDQPVKGAKAYFMRMIMHDYSDHVCIEILNHLVHSMTSDSRVLVCDMVLPNRVGEADFPAAVMDQAVMTMGGKERTEGMFRSLLEAAGLELVKIWRVPGVPGGCVEGRLKA